MLKKQIVLIFKTPPSLYIGVYPKECGRWWQCNGYSAAGKALYLSSGRTQEECAQKAQEKIQQLEASGVRMKHTDYGKLKGSRNLSNPNFRYRVPQRHIFFCVEDKDPRFGLNILHNVKFHAPKNFDHLA